MNDETENVIDREDTLSERLADWMRTELIWYAASFTFHILLIASLLLLGNVAPRLAYEDSPQLELQRQQPEDTKPAEEFDTKKPFEIGEPQIDPTTLDTHALTAEPPAVKAQEEEYNTDDPVFQHRGGGAVGADMEHLGGAGGINVMAWGPGAKVKGEGGFGGGFGGQGLGDRGTGHRPAVLGRNGGTVPGERAAGGALNWITRHQGYEGNWSFHAYNKQCKDASCSGTGMPAPTPAPRPWPCSAILGPDRPTRPRAPIAGTSNRDLVWLVRHQEPSGNLAKDCVAHVLPRIGHDRTLRGVRSERRFPQRGPPRRPPSTTSWPPRTKTTTAGATTPATRAIRRWSAGRSWRRRAPSWPDSTPAAARARPSSWRGKWLDLVKTGPYDSQFQYQPGTGAYGPHDRGRACSAANTCTSSGPIR